jgi:uncharacterized protein
LVDQEIRNVIVKFVDLLAAKGIRVKKAILYGSHASGRANSDSDLDVAIISPDFGKDRYEERKTLLQAAWRVDPRIEPIPLSLKSYEHDTWIPLIHEIRQKGVELDLYTIVKPTAKLGRPPRLYSKPSKPRMTTILSQK